MLKHLLFLAGLLLCAVQAQGQIPPACPSSNTPAADACEDACLYCDLASYSGSTGGYTNNPPSGFCGTIENEQWLGFVAGDTIATFTLIPSNCAIGDGVQFALYGDCSGTPVACNGGFSGGGFTPVSATALLAPGAVYYLMIDGYAGDICDFTLDISPPGAAIGIVSQTKEVLFCPGDAVTIAGQTYTQPGNFLDTLPSGNGTCDTIVNYKLIWLPQPEISETIVLAANEPYVIGGNTYFAPDVVQQLLPANSGCDTLATYYLELSEVVPDTCLQTLGFIKRLGEADTPELGEVICPSSDGNFYIAGEKGSQSTILKVTPDGDVIWSRAFQPSAPLTTHITDLVEDSEGMLAGAGIVGDGEINLKAYTFRYNPQTDNMIWSRLLEQQSPEAFAILEKSPGGNFLLLTSPQLVLNVDDAEIWELNRNTGALVGSLAKRYNFGVSDVWNSMVAHNGALYAIGRHIPGFQAVPLPIDKMRTGLSRIDLSNPDVPVWSRLSHVDTNAVATVFGQDLLIDNGVLVSISNGNDTDLPDASTAFFLQKNTLDGDLLWTKKYESPSPATNLASDIQRVSDGYLIIGWNLDTILSKIVMKVDFDGNVLWTKRLRNVSASGAASVFSLGQHQSAVVNDVLYMVGATAADIDALFIKMKSDGTISDDCNKFEPYTIVSLPIANPANTPVSVPLTQQIAQSVVKTVPVSAVQTPVLTACVSCAPVCDDTLDLGPDVVLCVDSTLTFDAGTAFVSYLWQDGSSGSTFTTNVPGIYWVEVTDACGDKQRDSVLLTLSLVADVELGDTSLCIGESITISVPGFDTYDWSPADGLDCDTCASVTILTDITTTYTLFATTDDGCVKNDTFTVTILPLPTRSETIEFCPGDIVSIGGVDYTQSATVVDTIPGTVGCDTIVTYTLIRLPFNTGTATVQFCPGESVIIGGVEYTQSGTVVDTIAGTAGCDTILTYTLVLLPFNTASETIQFCPGESVNIGGNTYTQPGTVVDTIPGTAGCDTIVTYTLVLLPQPTRSETVEFCPGESVSIGGNTYTQPGTVVDTLPAASGCDTIVTYTLKFIDTPNSSVTLDCPADIDVAVDPGAGPVVVNYDLPDASSDCQCPGIALNLTQGLAPGSAFPLGLTNVCYQAKDSCGNTATCCFEVFVREESACDVKTIGCMKWELLDITKDAENDLTYRIRVTNTCANKLIYTAIQMPDGLVAVAPANNSVFTAQSGRNYDVRNPNYSPFYSIRFKSKADSIANGQSDIFKYKLPGQTMPDYIHVNARLAPQIFYEAHLNTFNCPVGVTPPDDKPAERKSAVVSTGMRLFPNPTSGILYADFSEWAGENLHVQVFGSQGQLLRLLTPVAADTPQALDLPEGLPAGMYFLEVRRENGEKHTKRFVKSN
jgi:hypothetical protein